MYCPEPSFGDGTRYPQQKTKILDSYLTSYTKIKSKWVGDLNIRGKIIKLSKENINVNLCDLELDNGFLAMTSQAPITKMSFIKIKILCFKGHYQKCKNICKPYICKTVVSNICKELL